MGRQHEGHVSVQNRTFSELGTICGTYFEILPGLEGYNSVLFFRARFQVTLSPDFGVVQWGDMGKIIYAVFVIFGVMFMENLFR